LNKKTDTEQSNFNKYFFSYTNILTSGQRILMNGCITISSLLTAANRFVQP